MWGLISFRAIGKKWPELIQFKLRLTRISQSRDIAASLRSFDMLQIRSDFFREKSDAFIFEFI